MEIQILTCNFFNKVVIYCYTHYIRGISAIFTCKSAICFFGNKNSADYTRNYMWTW